MEIINFNVFYEIDEQEAVLVLVPEQQQYNYHTTRKAQGTLLIRIVFYMPPPPTPKQTSEIDFCQNLKIDKPDFLVSSLSSLSQFSRCSLA